MDKKVLLIIRDGWGYREESELNAIKQGETLFTDFVMNHYPNILLNASGEYVGLPNGYMGNSEVGHMTIGAGRVIYQSLAKINNSIKNGSFYKIDAFNKAIQICKKNNTKLHLIGLLQDQGVHSHIDHLFALLDLCKMNNFENVLIHVITDGRDAPVNESISHIQNLSEKLLELGFGEIVSISGRYFSMDRDKRWDRTKLAYQAIANGIIQETNVHTEDDLIFEDPLKAIKLCHANGETDEFINPRIKYSYKGFKDLDSVIFFNFRTDRTRQLAKAISEKHFEGFNRIRKNVFFVAMTNYYHGLNGKIAFEDQNIKNLLGEVVSKKGCKQLRLSETEKYAHVTYFFNGQKENPLLNEERILIDSPKVKTYDLKPEMSVYEITNKLFDKLNEDKYDLIVTNLVNGDMVGHTGDTEAIKKAVKSVDVCLEKIIDQALKNNYDIIVTADHGNAEDQTLKWRTSHTLNPVPFVLVSNNNYSLVDERNNGLSCIAPTILDLLGIEIPKEMTGKSLIKK